MEADNKSGRVFFFFKQKTAYEMLRSLVGSEMCIRDRVYRANLTELVIHRIRAQALDSREIGVPFPDES